MHVDVFQRTVLDYYTQYQRRDLPWRQPESDGSFDPYKIMVSEIMLQQTQVQRVIEKYRQFLKAFPDVKTLADAPLSDVLLAWQGLGYNRRGRYLRDAAAMVVSEFAGQMPRTVEELIRLPGIGHNTAAAIAAYSYDQPVVFIETNIRTVYLHHFFSEREAVTDSDILEVVAQTLDHTQPRHWYWALMDYGTHVKKQFGNQNVRSRHYAKQSAFAGSNRQIRGKILREVTVASLPYEQLKITVADNRFESVLEGLIADKLVVHKADEVSIAI